MCVNSQRFDHQHHRVPLQEKQYVHLLGDLPPALGLLHSGHHTDLCSLRTGRQQSAADLFLFRLPPVLLSLRRFAILSFRARLMST